MTVKALVTSLRESFPDITKKEVRSIVNSSDFILISAGTYSLKSLEGKLHITNKKNKKKKENTTTPSGTIRPEQNEISAQVPLPSSAISLSAVTPTPARTIGDERGETMQNTGVEETPAAITPEVFPSYSDVAALAVSSPNPSVPPDDLLDALLWTDASDVAQMSSATLALIREGLEDYCLLGQLSHQHGQQAKSPVFLNTKNPFCIAAVGVQGEGKSHTLNTILEACLLDTSLLDSPRVMHLSQAVATAVFHYDTCRTSICESSGLIKPNLLLQEKWSCHLPRDRMIVLVSPTYYQQRKEFYGDYCEVKPLLLKWSGLTADHIRLLMKLTDSDNQLYVAEMLNTLRDYQRRNSMPRFDEFSSKMDEKCKGLQATSLRKRLSLLETFIDQSDKNLCAYGKIAGVFADECGPGKLVIVDLTDPMLASDDVNALFQVLTQQFRSHTSPAKLLVLDEAHRYMDGQKKDGLSDEIVDIARLMRHNAMRLAISSQSPLVLAPELLELVSAVVIHRFHSQDWFAYLEKKLSLPADNCSMDHIKSLRQGEAMVFTSRPVQGADAPSLLQMRIRQRLTADRGATKRNNTSQATETGTAEASQSVETENSMTAEASQGVETEDEAQRDGTETETMTEDEIQ